MNAYSFNQKPCIDSVGSPRKWVVTGLYIYRNMSGGGILSYHDTQAEAQEEIVRMRAWTNTVKVEGFGFSELKIVANDSCG